MNIKLVAIGIALIIAGIILVGATVYQELVEEPQWPEDYHMTPQPTAKYEWRSRNPTLTGIGAGLIGSAVTLLLVGLTWRRH